MNLFCAWWRCGVEINPWDIAKSPITMMLPLGIELFMKARWAATADELQPHIASESSLTILFLLVGAIILQWSTIVSLIGTSVILAIPIFLVVSAAVG